MGVTKTIGQIDIRIPILGKIYYYHGMAKKINIIAHVPLHFLTNSKGDKYTANYQGSGRINQPLVKDFVNQGKTWQEILRYFYSNSDRSSGNILFVATGNHLFYKTQVLGPNTFFVCYCGAKTPGSPPLLST